jgi:hypothetical protein
MGTQEHIQKQPQVTDVTQSENKDLVTRGLGEQFKPNIASTPPAQDLKTKLSRAERFGHSLSKMRVPTSVQPTAAVQTKVSSESGDRAIQPAVTAVVQPKASSPNATGAKGASGMNLNTYKMLNQHVESLLPQLQRQVMQQSVQGDMQNAMQFAKGGGGGKGGMMDKANPIGKIGNMLGGGSGGGGGGGGGGGILGAVGGILGSIL